MQEISIFWFRRDLRLNDNAGLFAALNGQKAVLPIFIFDPNILDELPENDARVTFIYDTLSEMQNHLKENYNKSIAIYYDTPEKVFTKLAKTYKIQTVFTNHDYEPYALKRDEKITTLLTKNNISFKSFKDQVIFEKNEIVKDDGNPYVVFTPYKNKWKLAFNQCEHLLSYIIDNQLNNIINSTNTPTITLEEMGFKKSTIKVKTYNINSNLISNYEATRNFPELENGTSKLGPHLRFGTISIRQAVKLALQEKNETFWNELIWREFFMQIIWHFPKTVTHAFKPKYDAIIWRNNENEFELWKNGNTGYPLVDAGMRQLNTTGYMHNRVRMLVASFLCKHLLIDWRWGEAYFAEKLLDYDQSANVGNWQWAAGTGVDAAPYFRIFNPTTQIEKFDKQKAYINKWVTNLQELSYPTMMVDHKFARERCLKVYKAALE